MVFTQNDQISLSGFSSFSKAVSNIITSSKNSTTTSTGTTSSKNSTTTSTGTTLSDIIKSNPTVVQKLLANLKKKSVVPIASTTSIETKKSFNIKNIALIGGGVVVLLLIFKKKGKKNV
jgi:hypothetical protein